MGNEAPAIQEDIAKLEDLGKFYADISQKLRKIDLLFAEESLDVCAVDGFILEIHEALQSWKREEQQRMSPRESRSAIPAVDAEIFKIPSTPMTVQRTEAHTPELNNRTSPTSCA